MPYIPGANSNKKTGGYVPTPRTASGGYVPGQKRATSADITSSSGLYNVAVQNGFKQDADRVLESQSGEQTKKIFSGGFISDVFDVLNALDYGVVGMLKGKTFSEGVKSRQSFSDQDSLGSKGLPGVIAGTLLDIAVDPLTYVAPMTLFKKVPMLARVAKAAKGAVFGNEVLKTIEGTDKTFQALEGGTKVGKYLGQKFAWMFGADPIFKKTFEKSLRNTAISTQSIVDLGKSVAKLTPETASKILTKDEKGRLLRVRAKDLEKTLKPEEFEPVAVLYKKIDDLGKEAVDLGLLSKETYEQNIGEYIKNAYTEYEQAKSKGLFGAARAGIKGIKKRVEGLTPERMKELGQIENPAYLLFKSATDLARDVENAKLLKTVAEKFGTDVAQKGFTPLPQGIRLGKASGKFVPDNIAEYLTEVITPATKTTAKDLVANFKFFKVIMNPGTHARNVVSNTLLNWWKLGIGPWRADIYGEALNQAVRGGKWVDEAKTVGYNLDTFASAEMKNLLDSPEALGFGKKIGKPWATVKKKLGDIYQQEENISKLAAFIHQRKKGLGIEEAWKAAESATFNYAQVTPFVRKMRESLFGFPFITFTVKSTPVVAETLLKNPARVSAIGKVKQAIENLSDLKETDRERASEPSWVKDGFYIKLPMKDKDGRSAYFDLTYILPFGDLMSGQFFESNVNRETGLRENKATSLIKKSPFINLVSELGKNQDFYGDKIWRDSDPPEKQMKDLMRHITKSYVPPLISDQLPGGYNSKGVQQQRGIVGALKPKEKENQQRTLMQELLRNVGAKIQPVDADIQETYVEWNRKKALESLLTEKGILSNFNRTYIPKK